DFRKEPNRHYVKGQLAGQVLGFVNIDNQGQAGIEKAEESHLAGKEIQVHARRYNDKKVILDLDYMREVPLRGADVVLTIDETIQWIAERALGELCTEQNAKAGMAIVIEPNTGEVLALANYPFFDPERLGEYAASGEMERAKNQCITNIYEPGSTMKPFVVAAGLDCGAIAPDSIIDCEGGRRHLPPGLRSKPILDEHAMGRVPVTEVLVFSSNVGAGKIAEKIVNLDPESPSKTRFVDYLHAFGFGTRTGIELPGETKGLLTGWERWNLNDLLVTAFGTGPVMISPVGLAAAYCILANGGREVQPHVVKGYLANRNSNLYPTQVGTGRAVVNRESARLVREMLVQVVERGTGTRAKSDWYKVGGKTGTAKKVVNRVYSASHRALSFAGFAPADPPRIVVVVVIDEPDELRFGGLAAAPVFRKIVDETLAYLHVTPDFSGPAPTPDGKNVKPGKRPAGRQPLFPPPTPDGDQTPTPDKESPEEAARVAALENPDFTLGRTAPSRETAPEGDRREQW
ncbi:MAG: penicillin-binding protein 2, partial [Candidatus Omnitrophica bacterium]|nr:penicillin-binding protein 2 [Candidatus Omnitrophota bacterium]